MKPSEDTNAGRSEPFTTEQNDEAYKRLVSGDEKARNAMIEGNMALVVCRTDTYLRKAPQMAYYRDDMISAGLVGLCQAVDRMQKAGPIKNPKPTGCMTRAIDCQIIQVVDEANTIVVPWRVQSRARAEGKLITPPRVVSETAMIGVSDPVLDSYDGLELQEEILACCIDNIDRQIVLMRREGHTDAQIGVALSLSAATISRRRNAIQERLLERCPEYKETQRALAKRAAKKAARESKRKARHD